MSENQNTENNLLVSSTRRNLFKGVATGLVAGSVAGPAILSGAKKGKKAGVRKGRINQSVVSWCFADHWSVEETCQQAKRLGCKSVELIDSKHWPVLKKNGLTCAISGIPVDGIQQHCMTYRPSGSKKEPVSQPAETGTMGRCVKSSPEPRLFYMSTSNV